LPNLKTTVDALRAAGKREYRELFDKYGVMNEKEYEARVEIAWERYVKVTNIEANATVDIARNMILPAALTYQEKLAETIARTQAVSKVTRRARGPFGGRRPPRASWSRPPRPSTAFMTMPSASGT
jgi:glutamine synthetase type III